MKIKVIVLFVFMLMLCGCENWDDIYSEYKDILDEGINCSYSLISASTPSNYITSITFSEVIEEYMHLIITVEAI